MRRIAVPALLGLAVYWAVLGGEYSWFDLRSTRSAREREAAELAELHREIDSLRLVADSLEADSATLERLARERFGMIREGEVLYRFADPEKDTTVTDSAGR